MIYYLDDNLFESDEDQFFDFDKWVLKMLYYNRIDLQEENDVTKSNNNKKFNVFQY